MVKVNDGRAVPLGIRGTVEWTAGAWIAVAWDNGDKCAVRSNSVKVVVEERVDTLRELR